MLIIALVAFFAAMLYIFDRKNMRYWRDKGVPQLNPSFLVGDIKDLIIQKKHVSTFFEDIYRVTKDKSLIGLYFSYRPIIMINDLELAKNILSKDFNCFHDRGFFIDTSIDPLSANLFCLPGKKWKDLRQKVTPLFSTSKLKLMLPIIQENFKLFEDAINPQLMNNEECTVNIRDFASKLILTLVSSLAFGIDNDCFKNPENSFRVKTLSVLDPSFVPNGRIMLGLFLPKVSQRLKIGLFSKEVNEYFIEITKNIIDYREKNEIVRNDFMHLFAQLGKTFNASSDTENFTLNDVAANAFVFLIAGYESTASTISYCLFELARNPAVLKKVLNEIDELGDEKFSYEKINKLKYLENCVNETLRKYPVLPFLNRQCQNDYKVPESSFVIPKDTPVIIPIFTIHRDPKTFSNPMDFWPERFDDQKNEVPLLSFGYGGRTCIGKRMGLVVVKCYIYDILSKYNIELMSSRKEIEFSPNFPTLTPKEKILIKLHKRSK